MRLVDSRGRTMSFGENGLPGARYYDLDWEEVISQYDPDGAYTVEIRSTSGAETSFIFTVQTLSAGKITGRRVITGTVGPDEVLRISWTISHDAAGDLVLHAGGGGKVQRPVSGIRKDR